AAAATGTLPALIVQSKTPLAGCVSGAAQRDGSPGTSLTPLRRLLRLLAPDRGDLWVVITYAAGIGVLVLATPIAVQALVNTVAFGTLMQPLVVLAALLLMCLSFAATLRGLQIWVVEILQRRVFMRIVEDLSHRLPHARWTALGSQGPELVNRFFDVFTLQKAIASLLINGLEVVLTAVVGMLVLAFYHPWLLAFDLVLLCAVLFIIFVLGRGATDSAIEESKTKYAVAAALEEMARHPTAFKTAGGAAHASLRSDELSRKYLLARHAHFRVLMRQIGGALGLQAAASAALLALGGYL